MNACCRIAAFLIIMKSFLFVFWLAGGSDGWSDLDKDEEKKDYSDMFYFIGFMFCFFIMKRYFSLVALL